MIRTEEVFTLEVFDRLVDVLDKIWEYKNEWQALPFSAFGSLIGTIIETYAQTHGIKPAALAMVIAQAVIEMNEENKNAGKGTT